MRNQVFRGSLIFLSVNGFLKKGLIFLSVSIIIFLVLSLAGVMELADVMDSKSIGSNTVPVRVRPPAP